MTEGIALPLAVLEGVHLARLVEEFGTLLTVSDDTADTGVARLTPDAYPEDESASAEFSAATRSDLLERRAADAMTVCTALAPFLTDLDEQLTEEDALVTRSVVIPDADVDAWLRTLTSLRLVLASRLGIATDDDHDPEDARFGVYDWLGYRLDGLIALADAHDAQSA